MNETNCTEIPWTFVRRGGEWRWRSFREAVVALAFCDATVRATVLERHEDGPAIGRRMVGFDGAGR